MAIINLTEGTHTIKWTLSGYNDLTAQIKVSSTGAVTCISVTGGYCGGSGTPRVSISGTTVTGYMKSGAPSPTPTTTPAPGKVYVEKLARNYFTLMAPFKLQYDKDELNYYIYAPDGSAHSSGAYADYSITIPKSDTYKIVGRVLASSYSSNSFFVKIDSDEQGIWDMKTSGNYRWRDVSYRGLGTELDPEYPVMTKYFSQGQHKIRILHRENKTRFYKFVVTNDMEYLTGGTSTPTPTPTITPSPTPTSSYNSWVSSKGGDAGLKYNLPALLEIVDGYLGFVSIGFTVTLGNLLNTVDKYLGF